MAKLVIDTAAGKSISAYVVLDKDCKLVGKVHAYHGEMICRVDVWDFTKADSLQQNKATGYGYDKFTAALSGCTIAGVRLNDHCGTDNRTGALLAEYKADTRRADWDYAREVWEPKARAIGARFANWNPGGDLVGFTNLHYEGGLEKLTTLGYIVIQAI